MQKDKTPAFHLLVIDGNQSENKKQRQNKWIPAFAGMTNKTAPPCKDRSRPVGRPRGGIVPTDSPPRLVSFTNSRNQGFFNNPSCHKPPCPPLSGGLFQHPLVGWHGLPRRGDGLYPPDKGGQGGWFPAERRAGRVKYALRLPPNAMNAPSPSRVLPLMCSTTPPCSGVDEVRAARKRVGEGRFYFRSYPPSRLRPSASSCRLPLKGGVIAKQGGVISEPSSSVGFDPPKTITHLPAIGVVNGGGGTCRMSVRYHGLLFFQKGAHY